MQTQDSELGFWRYAFLCLLIGIAFFFGIGSFPLANNNDGLYAEVAREMLVTGNYLIPHLNFVPYVEKPPLLYWLLAFSEYWFGPTALAARLVIASAATSVVIALLWLGHRIGQSAQAFLAAMMLATSLGWVLIAHVVFFDVVLTAELTWIFCLFYVWHCTDNKNYLRLAYVILALAVLTKGFMVLFFVPVISAGFLGWNKQSKKILMLFDTVGLGLFFLVVVPWHLLASFNHPGFAWDYFINEHVLRFLDKRIPHDYYHGPFYYYLPRIILYILPWSLFIPLLAKYRRNASTLSSLMWFWFVVPLVFFSLSKAKANYYMIISMPALIWLLAEKMRQAQWRFTGPMYLASASAVLLLITFLLFPEFSDLYSETSIIAYLQTHHQGEPIFYYKDYGHQSTLVFYLQKRLPLIDADDADLWHGQRTAAKGWFVSADEFSTQVKGQTYYVALTKNNWPAFPTKFKSVKFVVVAKTREGLLLKHERI